MNYMSPEHFGNAEPVSLKIKIGEKSHEHHNRHFDGDLDDGLEQEEVVAAEESAFNDTESTPRWETEQDYDDTEEEESVAAESTIEAIEDGAFMISAESVRQYGLQYPGGYMAFERDFQTKWVAPIQDPFGKEVKKSNKNKMDAFTQFSHVSVKEFGNVMDLPDLEREEYLAEHHIDADDFENWRLVMEFWENSDKLAFDEETLVGDVARGAFAAKLEEDKLEV